MTRTFNLCLSLVASCFFVLFVFPAIPISAEPSDKNIVSRTAKIDNVELHYRRPVRANGDFVAWVRENLSDVATTYSFVGAEVS